VRLAQTSSVSATAIFSPDDDTDVLLFGGMFFGGSGECDAYIRWTDAGDHAQSMQIGPQLQVQSRVKGGTSVTVEGTISGGDETSVFDLYSGVIEIGT
jgi:hypothetical protein